MPCTTTAVNDEEDVFLYIYWHALLEGSRGNSWLVYINSSTERERERNSYSCAPWSSHLLPSCTHTHTQTQNVKED